MANVYEKTDEKRKQLDELANSFFPNLSSPELVNAAKEFEQSLD